MTADAPDRGDEDARRAGAGRRAVRDRRLDRRRRGARVEHPLADDADQAHPPRRSTSTPTSCCTRLPREGAGAAPPAAAGRCSGAARQRRGDRRASSSRALLYGEEHPYGRPDLGTPKSIAALTRDDVVAFHKRLFLPNNASLIVVGDTTPDAITADARRGAEGLEAGRGPQSRAARAAGRQGGDGLPRRQAGRRAVGPGGRPGRRPPEHARLLPADGDERGPRRPVLEPDQPEPPRGQGLHLRRPTRTSPSAWAPARSRPAASVQTDVHQGGARRADQGADRHHRPAPRHRRRAGLRQGPDHPGLPRPSSRRPSASPARSPSWSSTTCRPTTSRPTRRRSRPSPRPTSIGSPRSTSTRAG